MKFWKRILIVSLIIGIIIETSIIILLAIRIII